MLRRRTIIAIAVIMLVLGAGPAAFGDDEPPRRDEPAVVVADANAADGDEAWTFRFLVPTLIALTAIGIGLTAIGYLRGVKRRYRLER